MRGKATLLDNILVLALMGIFAGALGGLAVGIVTGRGSSASNTTSTAR